MNKLDFQQTISDEFRFKFSTEQLGLNPNLLIKFAIGDFSRQWFHLLALHLSKTLISILNHLQVKPSRG